MTGSIILFLAGFVVSLLMTPAGISGAFLLVPFQTSVLGMTSVSVTPTNLLFNLVATPVAIATYRKQGQLDARLAALITAGSVPGVLAGVWSRMTYFSDPARFRAVVGVVLVILALSLLLDRRKPSAIGLGARDRRHDAWVVVAALVVGVVGGVYGIGGGAFLAPLLAVATGRALRELAGATLVGTLGASFVGVVAFAVGARLRGDATVAPIWSAGFALGFGGLAGGYLGARLQTLIPERALRIVPCLAVGSLGVLYVTRSL